MIRVASKLFKRSFAVTAPSSLYLTSSPPSSLRFNHNEINGQDANPNPNPVAHQMINYAFSHARSQKSDESYAQGMMVLEQCRSTQSSEGGRDAQNTEGVVLLAMATLLSERGNYNEAIDKLCKVEELTESSVGVKVAALEALVGLNLELGNDDTSSVLADKCLDLLNKEAGESGNTGFPMIKARGKAVKGLVELVHGSAQSAEPYFQGSNGDKNSSGSAAVLNGNVALSHGEYLHSLRNFSLAREAYQKVIQGSSDNAVASDTTLAGGNMANEDILLAATCALGQLESHVGNFRDAEEILTRALTRTEEHFGSNHPKVGVILTCIALVFRWKAMHERSSSLLVQEGLFRKAMDLLKAPPLEDEGAEAKVDRRDIVALARGGYAEALSVQQNRKSEGEKLKSWAEATWRNRRMSLSEALDWSETSPKVAIIDSRICRVL